VAFSWPAAPSSAADEADLFERKIRPVLVEHCFECHAGDTGSIQGGLRLDDPVAMRRGGTTHGATDEFGMHAVEQRVHVHDLHATVLHLMGIDHRQLTFRYSGRDYRLTDVHGRVVDGWFA
jgi:hypothetical protein